MTTSDKISIMQSYLAGENIEFMVIGNTDWYDCKEEPSWNWAQCRYRVKQKPKYETEYIKPYYNKYGDFIGVHVIVADEDFVINKEDVNNGQKFNWTGMIEYLTKRPTPIYTFTIKQIHIITAFKEDIDKVMIENGGKVMSGNYLTISDVNNKSYHDFVWYYNSDSGMCNYKFKYNDNQCFSCRTIINLKK